MASFVSTGWPSSSSVTVKARDALGNPTGANVGAGGTADSSGTVTLPGLADATNYVATNGTRTVNFRTPNASTAAGAPADLSITPRLLSDLSRTGGWLPTGAIAETVRGRATAALVTLATGQLYVAGGMVLPGGRVVSSISFMTDTTAAATPTNQWFCLLDQSRNVLATTVDDTTAAWPASTVKTLQLATTIGGATPGGTYTPANAIEVYVGVCVVAGTMPSLKAASTTSPLAAVAPKMGGTIGVASAFTGPITTNPGTVTESTRILYAFVS